MKSTPHDSSTPHTTTELRPQHGNRKLWGICIAGIVVIAGAWGLRQQKLQAGAAPAQLQTISVINSASNSVSAATNAGPLASTALISTLQAAVIQSPKNVDIRWQLAEAYQKSGQLDKAAQQLQEIIHIAPHNLDARVALAKTDLALQDFKAAETNYIFLVQQEPQNASAWIGLSGALYHQGSYYEASEAARRAVTLQPNDAGRYVLALCLMKSGLQVPNLDTGFYFAQLYQARDELERLTKIWPNNGDIYYRLGQTYLGMSDGKNAVKNLLHARDLMPQKMDVHFQLAKSYIKLGEYDNALKVVEAALQKFPDAASLWNLQGQLYLNQADPNALPKAVESCQQAVKLGPGIPLFHERLGVAYQRSGKLVESCLEFETDIQLSPHNIFPYQQLAVLYRRRRDSDRAAAYAQRASDLVTNEQRLKQLQIQSRDNPNNVKLHVEIAEHFRDIRYISAARDEYLRAIKLDPANERARKGLASLAPDLARAQQGKKGDS